LDELGSGTDPQEGSALAMSLLDTFLARDVRVFASTHYPQLKAYAYDKEGVMNASVAFDKQTLKPTFRLLMHTPGTSHAFLISERLGLPQEILQKAQEYYANEQSSSTSIIEKLHDESVRLDQLLQDNYQLNQTLAVQKQEFQQKLEALDSEKRHYQERLKLEQDRYLKTLRQDMESFIQTLEEKVDTQAKLPLLAEAKKGFHRLVPSAVAPEETSSNRPYQGGDRVLVLQYNREGTLIKALKNGRWQLNLGSLQMTLSEKEFKFIDTAPVKKQTFAQPMVTKSVSMELDLRGQRVEEAQANVEKYLDDCVVANVPFGTIIHGFGTLALRNMVKDCVKHHPLVKRSRDGQMNEGGQGVTVVYFSEEKDG
jgi:DNA mismatch repair protein MutS2